MKISEASSKAGIPEKTIRYYEEKGMIPRVKRLENGLRDFDAHDVQWIRYAKNLRQSGIAVKTIASYVALFENGQFVNRPEGKQMLEKQIDKLTADIARLSETRSALIEILADYDHLVSDIKNKIEEKK